jgi:hypothetical protein
MDYSKSLSANGCIKLHAKPPGIAGESPDCRAAQHEAGGLELESPLVAAP